MSTEVEHSNVHTINKVEEIQDVFGDHAVTPVQPHEKRSALDVSLVTAGYCIAMSGLFTGSAMAAGLTLAQAILAALIGNTILAIYGGLIGAAGAKHGVSTTMLSRHAFGRQGAKVIGAVWAISLMGWFSVQTGFFGMTVSAMVPDGGVLTSPKIAALWGGILMILSAYFGYKGLAVISRIAIPALVILAGWGIAASVSQAGGWASLFDKVPANPIPLSAGIVMAVGSFAAGAVVQADITRYAKSRKTSWIATLIGYIVANSFVIIAGAVTYAATESGDLPAAMISLGLGIPAMLILIAAQWTTNDNNLYSSSLGLSNIIKIKKSTIVIISGLIATFFGFLGIADYFVPWLSILGIFVPPIAGILIADYYVIQKGNYRFGVGTEYSKVNWAAFVAWAIASLAGYTVTAGIPSLNSIIVAFVAYIAIVKLCEKLGIQARKGTYVEDYTGF
ncbi:cytosine permease [Ammoniphilus sp. YIM 78166]|uniref:cytosine permease n=1 Tax=Ammoniphilus sp. YIM 78166 TaxID=1644106 RepID=UPI00106F5F5C|nr:cytosine permease [Ammoniphilus sp. YIM 78166]